MKKKIYKVYAQCVRTINPITEITLEEALGLIDEVVNDMVNMGDLEVEGETDEEFADAFGVLEGKAGTFFFENDFFFCGDFAIIRSAEEPTRAGSYGWTRDFN